MPCNSDYFEANDFEIQMSRVVCLLDELDYGKKINPDHWRGYHPLAYHKGLSKADADKLVASLCSRLKKLDVKK